MSTNLEYRARESHRKEKVGGRPAKLNEKKGRQRSRARDIKKRTKETFFVGRTTRKFCSGGGKMRNASGHQCKVKMGGCEKKWTRTRTTFPPKNVSLRSFWKIHVVVAQKKGKEMTKKVCCTCKVAFLLIRPIVVFYRSPALPSPLSTTRFYICLNKL